MKGQAAAGADPAVEKKTRAAEDQRKRGATLKRLMDGYEVALPTRPKMRGSGFPAPKYVSEELSQLKLALADMEAEDLPAANLGSVEIRQLLETAAAISAATARARFGALSRFLDWCQDSGHIETNPCVLIARSRRPKAPQARSHYLTPDALARLWQAAGQLREPVWCDLVRFLIAMPCRRGEAARMDWSHVDLATAEWHQPSHMTKNRDPHRLHRKRCGVRTLRRGAAL
jgi:integrase